MEVENVTDHGPRALIYREEIAMWGWFDPMYLVFLAPAMLLALWAQLRVQGAYQAASRIPVHSGLSGAEAADAVLREAGVHGVEIEPVQGFLSDHYVPGEHRLRLRGSPESCRAVTYTRRHFYVWNGQEDTTWPPGRHASLTRRT
jgi:hypothetical protein